MGIVIDTSVLIKVERSDGKLSFSAYANYEEAYISAITCSELLVGVHKANTAERRIKRAAFVEHLLANLPILEFDLETARVHAETLAALPKGVTQIQPVLLTNLRWVMAITQKNVNTCLLI